MASILPSSFQVPDSLRRRVGATAGRQRIISEEGYLLVVLHAIPSASHASRREPHLFLRGPNGDWHVHPRELGTGTAAIKRHVERFHDAAEAFEDSVEAADSADDWFCVLRELAPFVRTTRNLSRVLADLRTELGPDPELIAARDRAVDVERMGELVHQWASEGLHFSIAKSNEEQSRLSDYISRSSHRLNLLAAATLPLTAVGSFFGVNLESGLEHVGTTAVFWLVGLAALGLGLVVRAGMPVPEMSAGSSSGSAKMRAKSNR